jgi:hypothetical protein
MKNYENFPIYQFLKFSPHWNKEKWDERVDGLARARWGEAWVGTKF